MYSLGVVAMAFLAAQVFGGQTFVCGVSAEVYNYHNINRTIFKVLFPDFL